ncbi:MAG: SAM-dependent methyltransferase [Vicinamibacterales bacterium]
MLHLFIALSLVGLSLGQTRPEATELAPYVPSSPEVVERMLALAKVGPKDVVYDLGCGDGRIVIAAAKKYGARGVGVDIDPQRISESMANARKAGVETLVTFRLQDALETDVSDATVVTLYLLAHGNIRLRPILQTQLRPGARIVSHTYGIGDWEPDAIDAFIDSNGGKKTLYLWRITGAP